MQRRVIRPIIGSLLALWILHQTALLGDEKPKEAAKADAAQIQRLIRQLGDDDFKKREQASKKLMEIGPPALSELEQALTSGGAETRRRAEACIQKIEEADPLLRWMRALCDPRVDVVKYHEIRDRAHAALMKKNQELMLKGPGGGAAPFEGLEQLQKRKERIANGKSYVDDMQKKEGTTGLIKALSDGDEFVRNAAMEALVRVGKPAVASLLRAFKSKNKDSRVGSLRALVGIRPEKKTLVPVLRQALADDEQEVRYAAVLLIRNLYRVQELVPTLTGALQNSTNKKELQELILSTLAQFGSQAEEAVPVLLKILEDENDAAAPEAAWAPGKNQAT